ncbi:TetR/AcrR family transcriptional regulator [Planotetraspora sp. A-T 1434]|uniref:TetR/AcrR family transcriptional regulator n=1 Tax=Planotetraspora sp. A-T 1434 TaxID=2979219 RepID=UPI0021C09F45|nr:TetR/AcrR family transcriptional regulator [Planotetraspora sp. A-T 1434]MCT9934421.1 TetR/AcrR family transcriptional regulator [Planotetraspora sp. A-T 1434]
MGETLGLRERKKLQTRQAIFGAALELFRERGFADVSVAEIAARAGISKMTVFNYFPTKEDIVMGPMEEHLGDPAEIASSRPPGEPVVAAFRRVFLERLAARAPETGLNENPELLQVINLVKETPSLLARVFMVQLRSEQLLAAALMGREAGPHDIRAPVTAGDLAAFRSEPGRQDLRARVVAGQIMALWRALQVANSLRMVLGEPADDVYPDAVAAANLGFDLLEKGLGDWGSR